jgi:hypothetical protein
MNAVLPDDHDGTVGVVSDTIRSRPEQVVAQEVPTMADHDQVVPVRACIVRDDLGGVSGDELGANLDATSLARLARPLEHALKERILLTLDLLDLARGGRVSGQPALDSQCGQPRTESDAERYGAVERSPSLGAVHRHEDALVGYVQIGRLAAVMRETRRDARNRHAGRKVEGLVTFTGRGSSNLPGRT